MHYLKHFMGPIPLLAPLIILIEIIGHLARILSLGMRLFGNIFGEHTATGIFMGMLPFVASLADDGPGHLRRVPADVRLHHDDDGVHRRRRHGGRALITTSTCKGSNVFEKERI